MKTQPRSFLNLSVGLMLALAGAVATFNVFGGQSVLMSPPPVSTQPMAVAEDQTNNELNAFLPSYQQRDDSLPQPLQFGPVTFRPHPFYSFLYASGVQVGTNRPEHSVIQQISPGIAIDLGRHWMLDYTPTIRLYSNHDFRDSVDHSASLTFGTRYEDWLFGFSQSFVQSDFALAETAAQTRTQNFDTELTASHQLNDHFFADMALSQKFDFTENLQDSREWSTMDWLNYQQSRRLVFGLGAGVGYINVSGTSSPDEVFEQLLARVQWRVTDKISLMLNGGLDERQFLASGYDSALNPIFGATIEYAPFDNTQISLNASRTVNTSDYYIIAQSTEGTTVSVNLSQRLLEKFFLNAGAGYTRTDYHITANLSPVLKAQYQRDDDVYFINARIGRNFMQRGTVALTYQYSDNRSTQAGFTYRSNQVGFEIGFSY